VLSFWASLLYLFSHLLIHRRGLEAAQHWPTFLSWPTWSRIYVSRYAGPARILTLTLLVYDGTSVWRSAAVVPFCWSDSVVPYHKECKQNMARHPSSSDSHFGNVSSSSELFQLCRCQIGSRDSVVGTATDYGLDDQGSEFRVLVGSRIFSTSSRPTLGSTQPPSQWVPGGSFPRG
jgi:hypothetical protein